MKICKVMLTNSKSPSTKALWNLAWFSWWCLAWKGSTVGGWWSGPPPPAPEIWFNCRCRWFWNLCLSSADSCGDCWGDGVVALCCWGCSELTLCCDGDMLAFGDALEWALVGTSPLESLWEGETWGWPLPWIKKGKSHKSTNSLLHSYHTLNNNVWIIMSLISLYTITPSHLNPHCKNMVYFSSFLVIISCTKMQHELRKRRKILKKKEQNKTKHIFVITAS